jgi:hypothetical protein
MPHKPEAADDQHDHDNRREKPHEPPLRIIRHRAILRRQAAPHNEKLVELGEVTNTPRWISVRSREKMSYLAFEWIDYSARRF